MPAIQLMNHVQKRWLLVLCGAYGTFVVGMLACLALS